MPSAKAYSPNDKNLNERASEEFRQRREMIDTVRKQYAGKHKPMLKRTGAYDDNIILNWSKLGVDARIAFLMPTMPDIELDMNSQTEDEKFVRAMWNEWGGASLLYSFGMFGAIAGHLYCVMDDVKEGDTFPRAVPIDPRNIITWWDEDDSTKVLWYQQQWHWDGTGFNSNESLWRKDTVARYNDDGQVSDWEEILYKRDGTQWVRQGEAYLWGSPLSPIVASPHYPTPGQYYGTGELSDDLIATNDAGNKVASEINRILRFHAFPKSFVFGDTFDPKKNVTIDTVTSGLNKDSRIENLEMKSDLASSYQFLNELKATFFRQARIVIPPGDVEAFRNVTMLGIMATYMPMITANEVLRRQYSQLISGITRRALMLTGRDYSVEPVVRWSSALPADHVQEVALIERQLQLGLMSKRTAAGRLGINYEVETQNMLEEALQDGLLNAGAPFGVSG